jgi:hypothetical protein
MLGVLSHPSRFVKLPSPALSQADIAAVRRGESRRVACFLRGSSGPYPTRLRQGWLYLSSHDAQWRPFWSIRRRPRQISGSIVSVVTRPVDYREPLVSKGGKYGGLVVRPSFVVVTCQTPSGSFDLVVPTADVPLVVDHFTPTSRPAV